MQCREVIYIHPYTPMYDPLTIPFSLPALIKRIPVEVAGFSHSEIKDEHIRNAKIIIIDIHWYLSLLGAVELVRKIRRLNPKAKIIAGGVTASEYAKTLVDSFDIDYVIRGDAEIPLPSLINALLNEQENIRLVPNVVGKHGFETPQNYHLTQQDLDDNEFYNVDFFPAFKKRILNIHKKSRSWPPGTSYPYLIPFRGCPLDCKSCIGGKGEQKKLFKRGLVVRSPERLRDDLDTLAADPNIRFVSVFHDFLALLPEHYSETMLTKKIDLYLTYEFTSAPSLEMLKLLLKSFAGGGMYFSCDKQHLTSQELNDPELMIRLIKEVKKTSSYIPLLNYNGLFLAKNKEYRQWVKYVYKRSKPLLCNTATWWVDFPQPDENGYANSECFYKFMNYNKIAKKANLAMIKFQEKIAQMIDASLPGMFTMWLRKFRVKTRDFLKTPSLYI